jgi:protein SCO1/2
MKKILIPIFAFAICLAVIWKWTYGFSAFTIYSYTLKEAGNSPRPFPDFQMMDQNGNVFNLKDAHKYVLINFVYLDCPSACHKVNNQIEQIYHLFSRASVPEKLEFVTVSFDLKNDDITKIKNYRNLYGNDIDGWAFALPYHSNQQDFTRLLRKVGIWTYQVPETGIINHSLYLFLISPNNKIIKIFDPARDDNHTIIEQINKCLKEKKISSLS